jgi:hypothetical protein
MFRILFLIIESVFPVGADLGVCPDKKRGARTGAPLPKIVQWFKTMTTNEYIRMVKGEGYRPITQKLWQRNYYERVIRNDTELSRIREYILGNPMKWIEDENHPQNFQKILVREYRNTPLHFKE